MGVAAPHAGPHAPALHPAVAAADAVGELAGVGGAAGAGGGQAGAPPPHPMPGDSDTLTVPGVLLQCETAVQQRSENFFELFVNSIDME